MKGGIPLQKPQGGVAICLCMSHQCLVFTKREGYPVCSHPYCSTHLETDSPPWEMYYEECKRRPGTYHMPRVHFCSKECRKKPVKTFKDTNAQRGVEH